MNHIATTLKWTPLEMQSDVMKTIYNTLAYNSKHHSHYYHYYYYRKMYVVVKVIKGFSTTANLILNQRIAVGKVGSPDV